MTRGKIVYQTTESVKSRTRMNWIWF